MNNSPKLEEISLRLEHLESAGDWLARSFAISDPAASQTGSLVTVLVEDLRYRILSLVKEIEEDLKLLKEGEKMQ